MLVHWPARLVPPPRESTGAPVVAADRDGVYCGVDGSGDDHADGDLAEVRGVGRVGGPGAGVEAHLAVDPVAQGALALREVRGPARLRRSRGCLHGSPLPLAKTDKRTPDSGVDSLPMFVIGSLLAALAFTPGFFSACRRSSAARAALS